MTPASVPSSVQFSAHDVVSFGLFRAPSEFFHFLQPVGLPPRFPVPALAQIVATFIFFVVEIQSLTAT